MKSGYCWTRAAKEDRRCVPSSVMRGTALGAARMRERIRTRRESERMERRQDLCVLILRFVGDRTAVGGASLDVVPAFAVAVLAYACLGATGGAVLAGAVAGPNHAVEGKLLRMICGVQRRILGQGQLLAWGP